MPTPYRLAFGIALALALPDSQAFARWIKVPVEVQIGERIEPVGKLPDSAADQLREEIGSDVAVGYFYKYYNGWLCDFWRSGGKHVVFSDDRYWNLTPEGWELLIGNKEPTSVYPVPFFYRYPPGVLLIGFLVIASGLAGWFFRSDRENAQALLRDPDYQAAAELLGRAPPAEPGTEIPSAVPAENAFQKALELLVARGVNPNEAELNLKLIQRVIVAERDENIDSWMAAASQLEHEGEWEKSSEVYRKLAKVLAESDRRREYVQNCLASIEEKQSDSESEMG